MARAAGRRRQGRGIRRLVAVVDGSRILVLENPRLVEAAAQAHGAAPVIATNGWPGATVLLLLTQLRNAGAEHCYHGDFDAAGLDGPT